MYCVDCIEVMADIGTMLVRQIEKASGQALKAFSSPPEDIYVVKECYADEVSVADRTKEAQRILLKYPDRIPVICEQAASSNIAAIDKRKFLVPKDLTMGQFMHVIRQRMKLRADEALFLFINSELPRTSAVMEEIYAQHRSRDGFLYVRYSGENAFG